MKKTITILFIISSLFVQANDFSFHSKSSKRKTLPLGSQEFFYKKDEGKKAFDKGDIVFSAGYGWPNLGKAVVQAIVNASSNASNVKAVGSGPYHFRGEYGLAENVGLGVSVNYISAGVKWTSYDDSLKKFYDNKVTRSSLSVLARLNFHFGSSSTVDPYFGIGAGYKSVTWKIVSTDPNVLDYKLNPFSPFGFETTFGVRVYVTDIFGFYTELGIAKSVIQAGLVLKL